MFRISVEAFHAWAQTAAAVGSTVAVLLLVWDRVRPKPLQLSGYLVLHRRADELFVRGYLFSEAGEKLELLEVSPSPHFEIAAVPVQTPAERARNPAALQWTSRKMKLRATAERGHTGNECLFEIYIRPAPAGGLIEAWNRWLYRPAIRARGLLPYRQKGKFRRGLTLPQSNLWEMVRDRYAAIKASDAHPDISPPA